MVLFEQKWNIIEIAIVLYRDLFAQICCFCMDLSIVGTMYA